MKEVQMSLSCRKKALAIAALSMMLLGAASDASQIAWVKDFDSALKQAAREKKFVFLDLSASW